jgi:AraC family transcriptional activator of pobA
LASEYEARHPFRVESLRAWLRLLLIECLRLHPALQASGAGPQAQVTQRFLLLLDQSFRTVRRVEDYATRLKVGPTQLVAWVRARTGYTPGELMDRRVCMEARRLLAFTSATAAEIGYDLGFKDPAHFGRFFKRHSGMSPGEARRKAARTVQHSPG